MTRSMHETPESARGGAALTASAIFVRIWDGNLERRCALEHVATTAATTRATSRPL